jgi:acrylyl-CoA reductase (NADPH)
MKTDERSEMAELDADTPFEAYVAQRGDAPSRGVRTMRIGELPPGDVLIRVRWSSINYKDGLAVRPDGRVARIDPIVPGIDLAGTVVASDAEGLGPGTEVLAHGYEIGVARHGGYAEYARVPADQVVPLPAGLGAREAMAIGTAGFTAALAVTRLEETGLTAAAGPVLVTGATGGVGRVAIDILAARGYEPWAATAKVDASGDLEALGAARILDRSEITAPGKPLESQRWAAAIDSVGGPTLPYILRTLRYGGAVAACGNAGGTTLETTVFPFILRAVRLVGIDSVEVPIEERRALWGRLSDELRPRHLALGLRSVGLHELDPALDAIYAGEARGRWVVDVGGRGLN